VILRLSQGQAVGACPYADGTGNDTMTGGVGNDTFYVDNAGDVVVELSSDTGTDLVSSTVTFSAAGVNQSGIENIHAHRHNGDQCDRECTRQRSHRKRRSQHIHRWRRQRYIEGRPGRRHSDGR